jgi:hypothetical protein
MSLTQGRDLRTGVQLRQPRKPARLNLTNEFASRKFDAIIVESGLSSVVDAHERLMTGFPPSQLTGASTALSPRELNTPQKQVKKKLGKRDGGFGGIQRRGCWL